MVTVPSSPIEIGMVGEASERKRVRQEARNVLWNMDAASGFCSAVIVCNQDNGLLWQNPKTADKKREAVKRKTPRVRRSKH